MTAYQRFGKYNFLTATIALGLALLYNLGMVLINEVAGVSYYEVCRNGWDCILKVWDGNQAHISKYDYERDMKNIQTLNDYKEISQQTEGTPTFVWAYPGTGKTMTTKHYKNFTDRDMYVNFPTCLSLMNDAMQKGKNIVAAPLWGSNSVTPLWVDRSVREQNITLDLILCLPSTSCLSEYMERYRQRDNDKRFMEICRSEFLENFEKYKKLELCHTKKIMLKPGQFLDTALIENGVGLYQ